MKKQFFFLLLIGFGLTSCHKDHCYTDEPYQETVELEIKSNGIIVQDSVLKRAQLYWIGKGGKIYENHPIPNVILQTPPFGVAYAERIDSTRPFLYSETAAFVSADSNIKTFYVEYNNNTTDTFL